MSAATHGRESRVIHYAVLASIVLHGLLFSFSMNDPNRRAVPVPTPIAARLVQAEPVAPPRAAEPQPPTAKPAMPAKPMVKPVPSPKPRPVAKAAPAPPVQPAAPAPVAPAPPAAEPAPAPSTAPAQAAAAPQPAAPVARPGADVDADSVGRFRMQVIEAAIKLKRYPRAAVDNNWEGKVDVRVTFGSDGRRKSVVIVRGSGHEILDKQAVDTVIKAEVPLPAGLRGKEFAFDIPVIFNLKDNPSG
jgi:protein TonB